jgi:integrase
MKMRREHVVPLSTQVVSLLKQVPKSKRTGLVFKASGGKPLCENTLNLALRRLGF